MPLRNLASVVALAALLGCGSSQHGAYSQATHQRFELSPVAHPDAVSRWYQCFALEDEAYRRACLAQTPGVRVAEGPALLCRPSSDPDLCRAFAVSPSAEPAGPSTVDDDNAGAAIGKALGGLLVGIVGGAVEPDRP